MHTFINHELKIKEKSRLKKIKPYKQLSLSDYLTKKEEISDDFLFFSAYEFFMCKQKRQKTGAVFTPEWITDAMVRNTIHQWLKHNTNLWECTILDPCCGTGNYIHSLINVLNNELSSLYPERTEQEILVHIIQNMIHAWDVNTDSLAICRERVYSVFKVKPIHIIEKKHSI
jgi:type I restriction-modification system DNA methylase subunit